MYRQWKKLSNFKLYLGNILKYDVICCKKCNNLPIVSSLSLIISSSALKDYRSKRELGPISILYQCNLMLYTVLSSLELRNSENKEVVDFKCSYFVSLIWLNPSPWVFSGQSPCFPETQLESFELASTVFLNYRCH